MRVSLVAVALVAALATAGCGAPPAAVDSRDDEGQSSTASTSASKSASKTGSTTSATSGTTRPTSQSASSTTGASSSTASSSGTSTSSPSAAPPPSTNKVLPPQVPSTRAWGAPAGHDIRPGMDTSQAGSVCTSNFLYHLDDTRYFLGLAAHCFGTGGNPVSESCPTDNSPLGTAVTLTAPDGSTYSAKLAYNSYLTMQEVREADAEACEGNDFALAELAPGDIDQVHPAVRFYGGPTRAFDADELSSGDAVHGYGNSDLRSAYETVPTPQTNPHDGTFLQYDYGGWEVVTRFIPPTIQGDSGSGLMGPKGEAAGVLSSGSITYTEEQYTNIAYALAYMQATVGWSPSVVTWAEFDAAGIEDP